jgi:hypothetical protein
MDHSRRRASTDASLPLPTGASVRGFLSIKGEVSRREVSRSRGFESKRGFEKKTIREEEVSRKRGFRNIEGRRDVARSTRLHPSNLVPNLTAPLSFLFQSTQGTGLTLSTSFLFRLTQGTGLSELFGLPFFVYCDTSRSFRCLYWRIIKQALRYLYIIYVYINPPSPG